MERNIDLVIENLQGGLRNYGYRIDSKPIEGGEVEYADGLRKALSRVDRNAEHYRKVYGLRGNSKRLRSMLHANDPEPGWGVWAP